jgi:hypothetical protein
MYQQCEVSDTGSNNTLKMLIKNISSERKIIPSGTHVLAVNILQKCDGERANASANSTAPSATALKLTSSPLSHLHLFIRKHCPNSVTNLELNTTMMFPEQEHEREDVLKSAVNFPTERGMHTGDETPILDKLHSKDTVVRDFTTEIMAQKKKIELNHTLTEDQRRKIDHPNDQEDVQQALLRQMCEKLAVIGIDFLQNQSISRSVFASAKRSDDYLSVIYESVRAGTDEFPNFVIKQGVLYKKLQDKVLKQQIRDLHSQRTDAFRNKCITPGTGTPCSLNDAAKLSALLLSPQGQTHD